MGQPAHQQQIKNYSYLGTTTMKRTVVFQGSSHTGIITGAVILAVIVAVGIIVLVVCKWVFWRCKYYLKKSSERCEEYNAHTMLNMYIFMNYIYIHMGQPAHQQQIKNYSYLGTTTMKRTVVFQGSSHTGIITGAVILAVIVAVGIIVLVVCKWVFWRCKYYLKKSSERCEEYNAHTMLNMYIFMNYIYIHMGQPAHQQQIKNYSYLGTTTMKRTVVFQGSSHTGIITGAVILAVIVAVGIIVLVVCKWVFWRCKYCLKKSSERCEELEFVNNLWIHISHRDVL